MICTRKAVKILVLFIVFIRKKFFKNIFNIFNIQLPKSFGVGGNTKTSSSAVGLQNISFSPLDYISLIKVLKYFYGENTITV